MGIADFTQEDSFVTGCAVYNLETGGLVSLFGQKISIHSQHKFRSTAVPNRNQLVTVNMAEIVLWDYLKGTVLCRYQLPLVESHLDVSKLFVCGNLLSLCR